METLDEACTKTDWQVQAHWLMPNHFHMLIETPQAIEMDFRAAAHGHARTSDAPLVLAPAEKDRPEADTREKDIPLTDTFSRKI